MLNRKYGETTLAVLTAALVTGACSHDEPPPMAPQEPDPPLNMQYVERGTLPDIGTGPLQVSAFYLGTYPVTWGEWQEVRSWAVEAGYDLEGVGQGCADDHPVVGVNWYDVVKWCNALSEMEGRTPVYRLGHAGCRLSRQVYRFGEHDDVSMVAAAGGYRLPTSAEWEYAARGGRLSRGYAYSGGDDVNAVAWYAGNSDGAACLNENDIGTWPVGQKDANELGFHDMSGNVWEWCFDWFGRPGYLGHTRMQRGGSWDYMELGCRVHVRDISFPGSRRVSRGFRVAASARR